ncbi:MAG: hypothetical protein KGY38_08250 [Desulfobacterales bacterium]|nr:hypothetical protein [Desulfobacterales bacterium]
MNDEMPPTMEDLKKRRQQSLENASRAIAARPDEYREVKQMIDRVLCRPVDISEYNRIARQMVRLLESLNASSPGSVFSYYYNHIHPDKKGDTRYFKVLCADLKEQIRSVDRYRRQRHNLRIIR